MSQVFFKAVKFLHDNGKVHGDISPDDIMFITSKSESHVVLGDAGLVNIFGDDKLVFETLYSNRTLFVTPEMITSFRNQKFEPLRKTHDIWDLGILLFILLCGVHPFPKGKKKVRFDF